MLKKGYKSIDNRGHHSQCFQTNSINKFSKLQGLIWKTQLLLPHLGRVIHGPVLEPTGTSAHHSCGSSLPQCGAHLALLQLHGALDPNPAGTDLVAAFDGQIVRRKFRACMWGKWIPSPPLDGLLVLHGLRSGLDLVFDGVLDGLVGALGVLHGLKLALTLDMATLIAVEQLEKPEMVVQSLGS